MIEYKTKRFLKRRSRFLASGLLDAIDHTIRFKICVVPTTQKGPAMSIALSFSRRAAWPSLDTDKCVLLGVPRSTPSVHVSVCVRSREDRVRKLSAVP